MIGDRLSVFIEANRFPPAINQHRYSVFRDEADSSIATTSSSSEPPTNYLPFIAPTAPFDPYKEKYGDHPAGQYGAQKFKNRQTMSSAPFGFERPVTPNFADEISFASSDVVVAAGLKRQSLYSPPRTPLFRPFKIPRKPLPPGANPFPLVSYTPPGSPRRHNSLRDNASTKSLSAVPQHGHAVLNTPPICSPSSKQRVDKKPWPNLHKPLPPSPSPARASKHGR
ncbi:hypothetical protein KCU85_g1506, partial [Aureobasidium melanogenum]